RLCAAGTLRSDRRRLSVDGTCAVATSRFPCPIKRCASVISCWIMNIVSLTVQTNWSIGAISNATTRRTGMRKAIIAAVLASLTLPAAPALAYRDHDRYAYRDRDHDRHDRRYSNRGKKNYWKGDRYYNNGRYDG